MKYSLDKYKFYQYKSKNAEDPTIVKDTVAAASTYAGRTVKGYAKCDPKDQFSIEKGQKLAAARCNAKIAAKRVKRASAKYLEAQQQLADARRFMARMTEYYTDAVDQLDEANATVTDMLKSM